jgi:hypothetical protein
MLKASNNQKDDEWLMRYHLAWFHCEAKSELAARALAYFALPISAHSIQSIA